MAKLLFLFSASKPVETHVHGFGPPWGDDLINKSEGRGVVGLHERKWLQISHRGDRVAGGDIFAGIHIEVAKIDLDG